MYYHTQLQTQTRNDTAQAQRLQFTTHHITKLKIYNNMIHRKANFLKKLVDRESRVVVEF